MKNKTAGDVRTGAAADDRIDDRTDFTQGSIIKKLVPFMMPILGALILQAMYGAVDLMIVGRFGTTEGISGVSTGSNVLNLVTFVLTGLAMGVTVLIGRYLGEKKPEKIGPLLGGTIALFASIAAVLFVVMITLAKPIAQLMQSPDEALLLTAQYIRICGAGIFFIIAYNIISSVFRGLGDSNSPLIFVAVACVVNIILDLVFVAGLNMNVVGAALATVIAQAVSVLLSITMIMRRNFPFSMKLSYIRFGPEVKNIVRVGFPIALQEFLTQISFMALVSFINRIGLEASSGYGVASKVVNFIMLIPSSIMQSMASFVSQNVGAGKESRARKAMLTGMGIGIVIGVLVFLTVVIFPDAISGIFTTDSAVIAKSSEYLLGIAPEAIVTAILFSFIGYFNGHQQTLFVMLQGIAQTFIVRLPMAYIMSIQPDASLTNIGLAAPTATCFGILINIVFFVWYSKKLKKEAPQAQAD